MNPETYGPVVQRALLTDELQRLRRSQGETQEAVARNLEWSVSKVIRLEGGHVGISRSDLEALLRHYGVTDSDYIEHQLERAREARQPGWWAKYRIDDKAFQTYLGYEAGASSIRVTHGLLIPGLLQTQDYRRAILAAYGVPNGRIDRLVALSSERQRTVLDRAPDQFYILDEAVIRRQAGDAMPDQLQHLLDLSERQEISIQVIPFEAGPHIGLRGPFVILSFEAGLDDVLYLENAFRGDLVIANRGGETVTGRGEDEESQSSREIAEYRDSFDRMLRLALNPIDSMRLIQAVMHNKSLVAYVPRVTHGARVNCSCSPGSFGIAFFYCKSTSQSYTQW